MSDDERPIFSEDVEGVRLITLDDGKVNAFDQHRLRELRDAVHAGTDADAIVIAGRKDRFSAGFNLNLLRHEDSGSIKDLLRGIWEVSLVVVSAPVPVIVACTGHALGAGALILLSADWRIGGSGPYSIGFNEVGLGVAVTAPVILGRDRLNPGYLTRATALAQTFTPAEAVQAGFLDIVVGPEEDVVSSAFDAARNLGQLPRDAFEPTKRRLRTPIIAELRALLDGPQ